jgi:transposase-like protein
MSSRIRITIETFYDNTTLAEKTKIIYDDKVIAPKSAQDVGLSQLQQTNLLEAIQDVVIGEQVIELNKYDCCPKCGEKIRKNGFEQCDFYALYSDHQFDVQRYSCKKCDWKSSNSFYALFGTMAHPDLLKLQCIFGSQTSYQKSEDALDAISGFERKINNHQRIKRTADDVGAIISDINDEIPLIRNTKPAKKLIVHTDGGHIRDREVDNRSFEAIVSVVYRPENLVQKDKHHQIILDKTCVASCKDDLLKTNKKYLYYAALKQGLTKETKVVAFADGAKNCWSVIDTLKPHCAGLECILDWFHIGKKFQNTIGALAKEHEETLLHIKWCVWHNDVDEAISRLKNLYDTLTDEKERSKVNGLLIYLKLNKQYLVNYEGRQKNNEPISSQVIESIIGSLINERYKKDQKMQWTRCAAHNLLQIRTSKISGEFEKIWPIAVNEFFSKKIKVAA